MHRPPHTAGETTISRIKTLVIYLVAAGKRSEANALLEELQLAQEDLEDETHPVGVLLWHKALQFFTERLGTEKLLETWSSVLAPENLGVWTRVLRGAETPTDAFRQLENHGTLETNTTLWETLETTTTRWRGIINITYDPSLESDNLLTLARAAELRAIPAMFGLAPGHVTFPKGKAKDDNQAAMAWSQEYLVEWSLGSHREIPVTGVAGLFVGSSAVLYSPLAGALGATLGLGLGLATGVLLHRDRTNRIQGQAQKIRLYALERGAQLREIARSKLLDEGAVIAGLYRLGTRLGTGGNGVIYQATRLTDHTPVAIKLLRSAIAHNEVASDRLRREAEAMGLAWHPNVVELLDQGALPNGTTYLVMELLEGESLAKRIKHLGTMTIEQVLPLAIELCDALSAVHSAGVIHRDIKPENVFLSIENGPTGKRERIKLLDFGIARVEWAETKLTQYGAPLGTPGYMAPEQEAGDEVDPRADIFSIGAVIFECLAGYPLTPKQRRSFTEEGEHLPSEYPSMPPIPEPWIHFLRRAIASNPRDRFPDAKAMKEALLAASHDESLSSLQLL